MEAKAIVEAVKSVIGNGPRQLQKPDLSNIPHIRLNADLSTVRSFERTLEAYTGVKYVVALQSGTAALHCALMAAGVGPGDEVLCPSLTFAATANAICHAGATPHFCDVSLATLGVHPFKLSVYLESLSTEQLSRIKAIIPVHLLGIPCAIWEINEIAQRYGMIVIEDSAEALGSFTPMKEHCGTIGKAGVLSFNLNKIVTAFGGGALLTNDETLGLRVRHLAHQAKVPHPYLWNHDRIGWNYEPSSIGAAVALLQLIDFKTTLDKKAELAASYAFAMQRVGVEMAPQFGNGWLNAILVNPRIKGTALRDEVINLLLADGYEARALFTPLHKLPHFKDCPRQPSLDTSEYLHRICVCLPSSI
jgi:perosamine synthetase